MLTFFQVSVLKRTYFCLHTFKTGAGTRLAFKHDNVQQSRLATLALSVSQRADF